MEAPWPALSIPFTQGSIVQVYPPRYRGGQVFISWETTAGPGIWFQVYLNGRLVWAGRGTSTTLPVPTGGPVRIDIGSVPAGHEWTSYAEYLVPAPRRRATLSWTGGTVLGADLVGFHVYGSPAPGESINYATPLETITAYPGGIATGSSGGYGWTSDALDSGTWFFAVVPFDAARNLGTVATSSVTVSVPPREPASFAGILARLQYTYSASTHEATLNWNPSPS